MTLINITKLKDFMCILRLEFKFLFMDKIAYFIYKV